jgi:hypothetical protein
MAGQKVMVFGNMKRIEPINNIIFTKKADFPTSCQLQEKTNVNTIHTNQCLFLDNGMHKLYI